tara:strand:- start:57 stop:248 length:192 start_codon:yes stop_codon:yes gene_type:complete
MIGDREIEMIDTLIAEKITSLIGELGTIPFDDIEAQSDTFEEALFHVTHYHKLRNDWRDFVNE